MLSSIVPLRSTGQFFCCAFVNLLRKFLSQNHNRKTAAYSNVMPEEKFHHAIKESCFTYGRVQQEHE
jgi:hypothetical protein